MNKKRKLKLPDGGSFDLAIPEGFGSPPMLNEGTPNPLSKHIWVAVAGVAAAIAVVAIVKALGSR